MKKSLRVIVIFILLICFLRFTYRFDHSVPGKVTYDNINLQAKIERFASADVFSFDEEVVSLQIMRYCVHGIFDTFSAKDGESYYHYSFELPSILNLQVAAGPGGGSEGGGGGTMVPDRIAIYDTRGNVGAYVLRTEKVKGDFGVIVSLGEMFNYLFNDLGVNLARFVWYGSISFLEASGEIVLLLLDIIFDVSA